PFYGRLDVTVLARAWNEIVRRHETLRTRVAVEGGRPVQRIEPHRATVLPVVDLSGIADGQRRSELDRIFAEQVRRPFDLSVAPLWRCLLVRLEAVPEIQPWQLLFVLHHIISDAWSNGVLAREMAALYASFASGRPSPLPELPVQYADFAV